MMITYNEAPSPNFNARAAGKKIRHLILHYTDTVSAFETLKILQDPEKRVSSHYFVDEDGTITRLVDENMRAWHAGKSWWEGEEDINSTSIGIEIQNPGHGHGYRPFPAAQITAVGHLCHDIILRHGILPAYVLAHSDIAPARKLDPGELFPWETLARNGIGLWPEVTDVDQLNAENILNDPSEVKSLLGRFGYDMRLDLPVLISSFQRHFEQDIFQTPEKIGVFDLNTVSRLASLYRQKLALRVKI